MLSNTGPSTARTVDVKDLLPAGVTYSGGSTTQGACVSGICQLGDVAVGQTITMVVTGTVGSNVTGAITNTAQVFADTADTNAANNTSSASSTVNTSTQLQIVKNDLTDPVYAGDTYLYEIVITNTGPSDALNVVITDVLPSQVSYVGGSPDGCVHSGAASGGVVTCTVGTLAAGASRDYLLNVRLDANVVSGTIGTNTVRVTTTTPIASGSILSDTESTTYWAKTGGLTDLVLAKTASARPGDRGQRPGDLHGGRDQQRPLGCDRGAGGGCAAEPVQLRLGQRGGRHDGRGLQQRRDVRPAQPDRRPARDDHDRRGCAGERQRGHLHQHSHGQQRQPGKQHGEQHGQRGRDRHPERCAAGAQGRQPDHRDARARRWPTRSW